MQKNSTKSIISLSWLLWFTASLFYAYQYIIRVFPSLLIEPFMHKFSINAQDLGQFSGLYYLGYASFHIPLGVLLDRWGAKRTMILCLTGIIAGTLPLLWSNHWFFPCLGRLFVGAGSSAAILSAFQLIHQGFDKKHFSRMLGGCVTIGLLGAIYGGHPLQLLILKEGWQSALQIVLFLGATLLGMIILIVPSVKNKTHSTSILTELKDTVKNPAILKICILAGCMVGPLEGFADVWGKIYLEKIYGLPIEQSAFLPSLIFIGMCIGAPLLGYFAERTNSYYRILSIAGFLMGIIFLGILTGKAPLGFLKISFLIVGILSGYQVLAIFKATTYVSEKSMGITTAWVNMVIMIFGYLSHSAISLLIHYYWEGTTVLSSQGNIVPFYTEKAYQLGLGIIPLGLFIGGIGFLYILKKEGSQQKNHSL
jgi:predicted MFS family arabinose efflux permease